MIKELVLHTGDCKTGSTSIQSCLATSAWSVPGRSLEYPAAGNHIPLAKAMNHPKGAPKDQSHVDFVRHRFMTEDADVGVISAEHFEFTDPERIAAAMRAHFPEFWEGMRVITYLRPHAERVLSGFAERTKQNGAYPTIGHLQTAWEKSKFLLYAPRLRRWRDQFGDRLEVRIMDRGHLRNGDVVEDFFDFVFPGEPVTISMEAPANSSLCVEDLVYMRELHRHIRKLRPNLGNTMNQIGVEFGPILARHHRGASTKLKLDKALVARMQDFYAQDAAEVDAEFLGGGTAMRDALTRAHSKAVEKPISLKFRDYHPPRIRGHIAAHAEFLVRIIDAGQPKFYDLIRNPEIKARAKTARPKGEARPSRPSPT